MTEPQVTVEELEEFVVYATTPRGRLSPVPEHLLRKVIAAARKGIQTDWQPIETVPEDVKSLGERAWLSNGVVVDDGFYRPSKAGWFEWDHHERRLKPTHWMPYRTPSLPPPDTLSNEPAPDTPVGEDQDCDCIYKGGWGHNLDCPHAYSNPAEATTPAPDTPVGEGSGPVCTCGELFAKPFWSWECPVHVTHPEDRYVQDVNDHGRPPTPEASPPLELVSKQEAEARGFVPISQIMKDRPSPDVDVDELQKRLLKYWSKGLPLNDGFDLCHQAAQALKTMREERDKLRELYKREYGYVTRIWEALGVQNYEEANGKVVDEIVADTIAERDKLREHVERLKKADEHAGYLVTDAQSFLEFINVEDVNAAIENDPDGFTDHIRGLRSDIYEYEKRSPRALGGG